MLEITSIWFLALSILDPLLAQMAGKWTAEGTRHQLVTKKQVRLEAIVNSQVRDDRLVSVNRVTEYFPGAEEPTGYTRFYWVRPKRDNPGYYDLGSGSGDAITTPTASGRLDGNILEVVQDLGGMPSYIIRSRTEFVDNDHSVFVETFWHGDEKISETTLRYTRVTAQGMVVSSLGGHE